MVVLVVLVLMGACEWRIWTMDDEAAKAEREVENWECSLCRAGMSLAEAAVVRGSGGGLGGGGGGSEGITVLYGVEVEGWRALARFEG